MTTKSKIAISVGIIAIVVIAIVAYFSNALVEFGLCRPGTQFYEYPSDSAFTQLAGKKDCYTLPAPKNLNGPCDKQTDCGTARCVLRDEDKKTGRGICSDEPYDCGYLYRYNLPYDEQVAHGDYYIDADGNIQKAFCLE